jgi:mutator protein MutT
MNTPEPSDVLSFKYPVSIKGVVLHDHRVLLLKNEREEWELPGGKLEPGESPRECLKREIQEETSLTVEVGELLDVYVYNILGRVDVLIVAYRCECSDDLKNMHLSHEHKEIALIEQSELNNIKSPCGYVLAINMAVGNRAIS